MKRDLVLENCISFPYGDIEILSNNISFKNFNLKMEDCIIRTKKGEYMALNDYSSWNSLHKDLKDKGIEVVCLSKRIREKIKDYILLYLDKKYQELRNTKIDMEDLIRDFSNFGTNIFMEICENLRYEKDFDNIENGIIVIEKGWYDKYETSYDINTDKMFVETENDYLYTDEQIAEIIGKKFVYDNKVLLYVLHRKFLNNELQGEEKAYGEILRIEKFLSGKKKVAVCWENEDLEIKEQKVDSNLYSLLWDLSKKYYDYMFDIRVEQKDLSKIKYLKYNKETFVIDFEKFKWEKEV